MNPIETADYHTGGEPFRIVVQGIDPPSGSTVLDRRAWAQEHLDSVRRFLVNEPRGHADMYGCFVTPPDDAGAEFGLVFFHKDGFSTACGHGTIAAATWAIETGLVQPAGADSRFSIDVPSGRVDVDVRVENGRVQSVGFTNVPSWVSQRSVAVPELGIEVDVSYGGAFYASASAAALGLEVRPEDLPRLIDLGRKIKRILDDHDAVRHPTDPRLSGCYGMIWWQNEGVGPDELLQRNVTVFADGEVDRSPCGSGTSARLAVLDISGALPRGRRLRHLSIVGSTFLGEVSGDGPTIAGRRSVMTRVEGSAHATGQHRFTLDPADELGLGFQLR